MEARALTSRVAVSATAPPTVEPSTARACSAVTRSCSLNFSTCLHAAPAPPPAATPRIACRGHQHREHGNRSAEGGRWTQHSEDQHVMTAAVPSRKAACAP